MSDIVSLQALEILDSRGTPTISVTAALSSGVKGTAHVPSGASTGIREAIELRDGDKSRFLGRGVLKACAAVENELSRAVLGMQAENQRGVDDAHSFRNL